MGTALDDSLGVQLGIQPITAPGSVNEGPLLWMTGCESRWRRPETLGLLLGMPCSGEQKSGGHLHKPPFLTRIVPGVCVCRTLGPPLPAPLADIPRCRETPSTELSSPHQHSTEPKDSICTWVAKALFSSPGATAWLVSHSWL